MDYENDSGWCRAYLAPDEYILWSGRPMKGKMLTKNDIIMIPFSIMWCSFAIFWEYSVISIGAPLLFRIWGIPFVLVGLYIVFGRFFHAGYLQKRTFYAITNQRIFRLRNRKVDILDGRFRPAMHVSVNQDGSGTILFDNGSGFQRWNRQASWMGRAAGFTLENIPDVNQVQQIILTMDR